MRKITQWFTVAILLIPFNAFADSFTWKEGATGDISTATNWTGGVSPFNTSGAASTGTITISSGAPTYTTINLSGDSALTVSGVTSITGTGDVTVAGSGGLTVENTTWSMGSTATFKVTNSSLTLKSGTNLTAPAKNTGFYATGTVTIESGATLKTTSAQIAAGGSTSCTVNVLSGGTWTMTGGGRLAQSGTCVVNLSGTATASGYLADESAGNSTFNIKNGGFLKGEFTAIATRGTAVVNIEDGGSWSGLYLQTLCFGGGGGNCSGTIMQSGGTVSGNSLRFGSDDTNNATAGGKGNYFLNGGTLTLTGSMTRTDIKTLSGKSYAKNVTGTLYLGYSNATTALNTATGVASIGTISGTILNANAGTLYTKSISFTEGTSTIQNTASVNLQTTLPTSLTTGTAGLNVKNSGLNLSGTAELKVASTYLKVGSTDSANPATITLNDSAKLTLSGRPADDTGYLKLGTTNQQYAKIVLNGSSSLTTVKPDLADTVGSTGVIEVHDSATWTNTSGGRFGSNGKFTLNQDGGTVDLQGGMLSADYGNGVANFNISGGTLTSNGSFGMATRGKAYLNISGTANVILPTIKAGYGSAIGSHDRIIEITQTGGTLTVNETLYLADELINKMPVYTISDGSANIGKVYGIDVNYKGGTLEIDELHLSQTTSTTTTRKNTLDIQLSDDFNAADLYIAALDGEGTINISAEAGYLFDPNANKAIFTTTNGGAGLDLSQITFTNTLGIPTSDWRLTLSNGSVILGTTNSLPEPATWVMLVLGVGLFIRRRH